MAEIDVSGCVYIYKNTDCLCGDDETSSVKCNDNADCMYKQLKRLEQRLEKIKEIATKYSQHEGYLLDGLFTDLVDDLSEVLKNG